MRRILLLALTVLVLSLTIPLPRLGKAADTQPLLHGWGGINANEPSSTLNAVFSEMKQRGYNAARVSIIDPGNSNDVYDKTSWLNVLSIAQQYGFTIIGDDHEYDCPSTTWWQTVFQDTPQSQYPNVVWEPKNEPHCATLAQDDQNVINLARNLGDTRWFVLGCNNDCSPGGNGSDLSSFPVVTDPQNHVFYDFHEYYFYSSHSSTWSTSDAIAWADSKWAGVQDVINNLHRPFLGTEWGAETGCTSCVPDQTVTGSAGYSPETLAYVKELVTKSHAAGVGYTIWNAGDWNDPPAGITGALDTFGQYLPTPSSSPSPLSAFFTFLPSNPNVSQSIAFTGTGLGGTGPYTFSWNFGDGSSAAGGTATHAYSTTGSFTVTLTVTDSLGATASVSQTVTVSSRASLCSAADFNGNGRVDLIDVSIFDLHFGQNTGGPLYDPRYDLNHDGKIDIVDLVLLAQVYGQTC